ncbi:hypothetical protein Kisp02_31670 [Kineosporia sp. NBRC 101731]|nr:hypothetical protein Kisp02_31670 [Kineosporia sp. NBRC 101731]
MGAAVVAVSSVSAWPEAELSLDAERRLPMTMDTAPIDNRTTAMPAMTGRAAEIVLVLERWAPWRFSSAAAAE